MTKYFSASDYKKARLSKRVNLQKKVKPLFNKLKDYKRIRSMPTVGNSFKRQTKENVKELIKVREKIVQLQAIEKLAPILPSRVLNSVAQFI